MTDRVPMTIHGARLLQEELECRKSVDRRRITQAIAEAKALGDLKENAEYHAAREEQSFNEGRILEIEAKLSQAEIIDVTRMPKSNRVIFGVTVHLINIEIEERVVYRIVGEDEADVRESKISVTSPIARALIGKSEGDEVQVRTPRGVASYEITLIEYV